MSDFLTLPECSPAAPLMAALVKAGDLIAEHGDLLPPDTAVRLFAMLCRASHELLLSEMASSDSALAALDKAADR